MSDKRGPSPQPSTQDEELDDALIAADQTGMLAGERLITQAEIEEHEPGRAGDV